MKILCVIDDLTSGGAQRQLVELAKEFVKEGNSVSFLTYHKDEYYLPELRHNNINYKCIEEKNYLRRLWKMRSHIRQGKFDVVISFLEAANFICEVAGFPRKDWKLIVGERSANPKLHTSFKLKSYRWFHVFADYVVSNSRQNLQIVRKICPILPSYKCRVIYNIIDLEKWKPKKENYTFRKNGHFNLTIAASHQHLKNLDGLIEAVNLLSNCDKENLKINWYGRDEIDDSAVKAIEKIRRYNLDKVFQFHPPTYSILEIMNEADAIGLFSIYEGLPNTVCEGMSLAKPIVASNVSDNSLLIQNNISGFLCDPYSPEDISMSLKKLIDLSQEEADKMGQLNRKRAEYLFDKKTTYNKYRNLFS